MTPDEIVQTAQGLFVKIHAPDEHGMWPPKWYLVRDVEGTVAAPVVVLSGPVTFEVRSAPVKVDD
jgi:hypothetical protein